MISVKSSRNKKNFIRCQSSWWSLWKWWAIWLCVTTKMRSAWSTLRTCRRLRLSLCPIKTATCTPFTFIVCQKLSFWVSTIKRSLVSTQKGTRLNQTWQWMNRASNSLHIMRIQKILRSWPVIGVSSRFSSRQGIWYQPPLTLNKLLSMNNVSKTMMSKLMRGLKWATSLKSSRP